MKHKIIITGAAGTGKTSLIDALFENLQINSLYQKLEETVRILCAERGYSSPYDIKDDVHKFREDLLARQIQRENFANSFISDRSTIDAWSYFMRWSWNYVEVERAEAYYQQAFAQAQKYDLIIYVPIMFETVHDDGFRWDNKIYQEQMDRLIRSVIRDWGLESKVYEIKSINKAERVEEILSHLALS